MPDWIQAVDTELAQAETDLTIDGQPAPSAYVFVTNRGFMHALDSEQWTDLGFSCGYKINDFASRSGARSILELAKARERHLELHWLRKALQTHNVIPNRFDDGLLEADDDDGHPPRLLIGSTYLIPDESGKDIEAVLTDASVIESQSAACGTYRLQDGRHVICESPLTDAELAAYRRSPDTFFGVLQKISPKIQEPLDCYDFFWQVYSKSGREALLELVSDWPDYTSLTKLDQKELAQNYCSRMAEMMWATHLREGAAADNHFLESSSRT